MHYNYYFYYHLNPDFPADKIVEAIKNKDWDYFNTQLNTWGKFYLPNSISVFNAETDDYVGAIPMTKENFYKITFSEYECG